MMGVPGMQGYPRPWLVAVIPLDYVRIELFSCVHSEKVRALDWRTRAYGSSARVKVSHQVVELHRNLTRDLHGTLTHPMSRVWLN